MNPTYDFTARSPWSPAPPPVWAWPPPAPSADSGAAVVLADRDHDAAHKAAEEITGSGGRAIGVVCDVTDEQQVEAAVRAAVTAYGRLDMAFNNAGIQVPPTDAADETAWAGSSGWSSVRPTTPPSTASSA